MSSVKAVEWRDLRELSRTEIALDLVLWLPWLTLAWVSVHFGLYLPALVGFFFFFLTGLRQAHEAFHRNLGLSARACDLILVLLSPLMLSALHATRYIHLRHHKYCLGEKDVEGEGAAHAWWAAMLRGIVYPVKSHAIAWRDGGNRTRRFMVIELACVIMFYGAGLWLAPLLFGVHLGMMFLSEWMASFFAVWMVHHDCAEDETMQSENVGANPSRSIRGFWRGLLTYNMFYHHEHHALPRVPTRRLPELARRLDALNLGTSRRAF